MIEHPRRLSRLFGLGLALLLSGCATTSLPVDGDPFAGSGSRSEGVLLTVENNDFRDASIYAVWDGVRTRVGSVTGKTSQTFRIRWRSEDLRLDIDFLGAGEYSSESIGVFQGDHLNFVIMPGA